MQTGQPSQTARGAAAYRAIHQTLDGGAIFKDPFASKILDDEARVRGEAMAGNPALRPMRLTASVAEVRAYLRATARTVLAAHWRETLGRQITSIEDIEQPADSEEAISTAPQRVAQVLDRLPDRYRQILESRFLQGNSIKQSAAELGISVANAKVLQHRALRLAAQVNDGGRP